MSKNDRWFFATVLALCVCHVLLGYAGLSAVKVAVHWVFIFYCSCQIVALQIKSIREKGWRGLFVVQMADFLWTVITVAAYVALYFAGILLIRAIGTFIHRVLLSPEHSKWAWVRRIRDRPIDKRSEGFWRDAVSTYKLYVKWDHEEAVKAVDYYRNLTRRRREWVAKMEGGEA